MAGPSRKLAVAHGAQLMAQCLLADRHLELVPQPLYQVDDAPTHHPVHGRDRSYRDDFFQRATMAIIKNGLGPGSLARRQTINPSLVEAQDPVTDDLQRHSGDPGRLAPAAAIQNRRDRQQPPNLSGILAAPGKGPN